MKKLLSALMLCLVSIVCFAGSVNKVFGAYFSEGDFTPNNLDFGQFDFVEWTLLSDDTHIVLSTDNGQLIFNISRETVDTNSGIKVWYAKEVQRNEDFKIYFYKSEEGTKFIRENDIDGVVYEMDFNDYMDRGTISVLILVQ